MVSRPPKIVSRTRSASARVYIDIVYSAAPGMPKWLVVMPFADHQVVVADPYPVVAEHLAGVVVDADHGRPPEPDAVVLAREVAQRVGHVAGVQPAGGHLVEQRLERVVRVPVDQGDPESLLGQLAWSPRFRRTCTDDDHMRHLSHGRSSKQGARRSVASGRYRNRLRTPSAAARTPRPSRPHLVQRQLADVRGADRPESCSPSVDPDDGDVAASRAARAAICSTSRTVSAVRSSSCHCAARSRSGSSQHQHGQLRSRPAATRW